MDRYITRLPSKRENASKVHDESSESSSSDLDLHKPPEKTSAIADYPETGTSHSSSSSSSSRMRSYKDSLSYDPKWKKKYPWMDYNSNLKGMVCTVCKAYGKVPVQAKGAWVT